MNLFAAIRQDILTALEDLTTRGVLPEGLSFDAVTAEPPRDPLHGDMATNAAMVLAKPAQMKPRDLAEALRDALEGHAHIASVEVAGPGFLNLRLSVQSWHELLRSVLAEGRNFGRTGLGAGARVNVEFVSANPTGPLHVGHTRGAVFGDALASLLDFAGYDVTREYYINDGGAQVDVLARSVYLRYLEAHGQEVAFADGTYPGDYLKPVGEALKEEVGARYLEADEAEWLVPVREFATARMMALIKEDLAALGVEMDHYFSEKSLYGTGRIEAAIEALNAQGLIYQGVLEPPKGKTPDDWEPREQTLFRSTAHGDDVDRPIMKSDGSWTYFAPDIAYHYDKVQRGFTQLIDILGADHGGYVKRMKAAVSGLSGGQVPLEIKLMQLVKLYKNGVPFKMSKRAGSFVMLRDVIDEVGPDVTRFVMLMRKNDAPLDFDFDKVMEQSKDNPVFYVQYAHARINSVFGKLPDMPHDDATLRAADLAQLKDPTELRVVARLAEFPRMIELAAKHMEPHRVAFYLYELASEFHSLWNLGKDKPELRFLQEDNLATTTAKIALIRAVALVIQNGLAILGVKPVDEMR